MPRIRFEHYLRLARALLYKTCPSDIVPDLRKISFPTPKHIDQKGRQETGPRLIQTFDENHNEILKRDIFRNPFVRFGLLHTPNAEPEV